jgi:hypothetical protein
MIGEIGKYLPGSRTPREFVCDTEADVADLPSCMCGAKALIIATGNIYVVNASGAWVKIGNEG